MGQRTRRTERLINAWNAAWNDGHVDAFDEILSRDYVRRSWSLDSGQDLQQLKSAVQAARAAFPDIAMTIYEVIEEDSRVAIRWLLSGTHTRTYMDAPPTGRRVNVRSASFARFNGDTVVEEWLTWDERELLGSLGIPIGYLSREPDALHCSEMNIEQELLRRVHGRFVTGVTVVTTQEGSSPKGLAVNAFSSVSLDPPLVLVCVQKTSTTYPFLVRTEYFAINILASHQADLARTFAGKSPDKFAGIRWHPGSYESPIIDGSCAYMEVRVEERIQTPTHTIFIGRVVDAHYSRGSPLIYKGGAFYDGDTLESTDKPNDGTASMGSQLQLAGVSCLRDG